MYVRVMPPRAYETLQVLSPSDLLHACIQALRGLGYQDAAIIGAVTAQSDALEPITLHS